MRVLFITPFNCDLLHAVSLPLGLISIASNLQSHGHIAKILDLSVKHVSLKKEVDAFSPDIIGISVSSQKHINGAVEVSKKLKNKGVPIVWGGTFCDVADTNVLLQSGMMDYLSFCEGEATWLDIMNALENGDSLETIKGLAYLSDDNKVVITPEREFVDLTKLPMLDYSLVDVNAYSQYLYGCKKLMYVYLSKGCPAKCTFCANQLTHRYTYRRRSLEHFMKETEVLVKQYGVDGLYFGDEVCFLTKEQVYEVCDAFEKSKLKFFWGFQTRIGILSEAEFQRCYDCGCRWIDFGVESGNKEQLKAMKKAIPYEEILPTFDICDKIGIISLANFIIGLPGETEEQLRDTVNLAKAIKATQCSFLQFCLSVKTEMGKKAMNEKDTESFIKDIYDYNKVDFFRSRMTNFSHIPQKEIEVIQSYFLLKAILKKDYTQEAKSYDLFIKHIKTFIRRLMFLSPKYAISCTIEFVLLALRFLVDSYCYPEILKKYGLK